MTNQMAIDVLEQERDSRYSAIRYHKERNGPATVGLHIEMEIEAFTMAIEALTNQIAARAFMKEEKK